MLKRLADVINVEFLRSDISVAYRLQGRKSDLCRIFHFSVNKGDVDEYFSPVTSNPQVFINEHLTTQTRRLFNGARELVRQRVLSVAWTNDGRVLAKSTLAASRSTGPDEAEDHGACDTGGWGPGHHTYKHSSRRSRLDLHNELKLRKCDKLALRERGSHELISYIAMRRNAVRAPCGDRSLNSNLTRLIEAISRHFTDTANSNQHLILAGDINFDILNTNHHSVEKRLLNVFYDKGFVAAVNQRLLEFQEESKGFRNNPPHTKKPKNQFNVDSEGSRLAGEGLLRSRTSTTTNNQRKELFMVVDSFRARSAPIDVAVRYSGVGSALFGYSRHLFYFSD
ncbi:hypothetical protein J6590_077311 [Homalodisca vitripennis]|nr:hypothetical protein J6590_077311 [Homalodisca vitripennis]